MIVCRISIATTSLLAFEPSLKHQDIPEQIVPVANTSLMLGPFPCDAFRVEVALALESRGIEQLLRPSAQWPAQPGAEGNTKSHLGAPKECLRPVTIQDLP